MSRLLKGGQRNAGITLALLGIPIAWARIYRGVHFPFDMLGAVLVAAFSAWLSVRGAIYRFATDIHHRRFGRLIALGWVRRLAMARDRSVWSD